MARGTTRHLCRDEKNQPLKGRRAGPKEDTPQGHVPGCRRGVWMFGVRVPTTDDPLFYFRRSGLATRKEAEEALQEVVALLALVGDQDPRRFGIGNAIVRGERAEEIRRKVGDRVDPAAPTPTVARWCDRWLAAKGNLRETTRTVQRRRIELYIKPALGDLRLDELDEVHVRDMFEWIERRNVGDLEPDDPKDNRKRRVKVGLPAQHQLLSTLRSVLKAAVERALIVRNPLAGFSLESYVTPERSTWSPAQVRTFLAHAEDDRLAVLYRVVLLHGLRRGEVCGLRWQDLDLERSVLHVRQQHVWVGGEARSGEPKSRKSRRSFRLDAGTVAALRAHRARQGRERMRVGAAWEDRELVFCNEDGSALKPYAPLFPFQRLAREAGLPVLTLHEGRHTAATNMLLAGISPKVVSERMGHATVGITLDLYGHVLPEMDEDAASRIGTQAGS